MNQREISSQVWREHCEKVRQIEKARRASQRGKVKIGAHYVPPPAPVVGAIELPTEEKEPSAWIKVGIGVLIVSTFMLVGWAL